MGVSCSTSTVETVSSMIETLSPSLINRNDFYIHLPIVLCSNAQGKGARFGTIELHRGSETIRITTESGSCTGSVDRQLDPRGILLCELDPSLGPSGIHLWYRIRNSERFYFAVKNPALAYEMVPAIEHFVQAILARNNRQNIDFEPGTLEREDKQEKRHGPSRLEKGYLTNVQHIDEQREFLLYNIPTEPDSTSFGVLGGKFVSETGISWQKRFHGGQGLKAFCSQFRSTFLVRDDSVSLKRGVLSNADSGGGNSKRKNRRREVAPAESVAGPSFSNAPDPRNDVESELYSIVSSAGCMPLDELSREWCNRHGRWWKSDHGKFKNFIQSSPVLRLEGDIIYPFGK